MTPPVYSPLLQRDRKGKKNSINTFRITEKKFPGTIEQISY